MSMQYRKMIKCAGKNIFNKYNECVNEVISRIITRKGGLGTLQQCHDHQKYTFCILIQDSKHHRHLQSTNQDMLNSTFLMCCIHMHHSNHQLQNMMCPLLCSPSCNIPDSTLWHQHYYVMHVNKPCHQWVDFVPASLLFALCALIILI